MKQKAILAFSGGLDTSVVVKYLQEKHNMDVVTVTVDVGQEDDYKKISAKAKKLGVKKHYNIDAKKEFVLDYIFPAIKANALYQKKYCLATALARPLIARKILQIAKKEKVSALAHGCSGKGNDQVRFDLTMHAGSDLPIIAPIRDLNLSRPEELKFAKKHGIKIENVAKKFSIDQNLWGRAIEGGVLENPNNEPPDDAFIWVKTKNLLKSSLKISKSAKIPRTKIVLDPAIGFFRRRGRGAIFTKINSDWVKRDLLILKNLKSIKSGRPILVSVSNKSFIGKILKKENPSDRLAGSLAAEVVCVLNGADIIRTHNVGETKEAITTAQNIS